MKIQKIELMFKFIYFLLARNAFHFSSGQFDVIACVK